VEWYLDLENTSKLDTCIEWFFKDIQGLYIKKDQDVIQHLFRVTSSLNAQVVGEPQILGQVKRAYHHAKKYDAVSSHMDLLFQKSFFIAKKIRSETKIGQSFISMSSIAIDLAKKVVGHFSDKEALVIGAGEMSEIAAKKLSTDGISRLWIANRTFEQAATLAKQVNGYPMIFSQIFDHLENIDIVFVCTGARQPIITKQKILESLGARPDRPIMMVDISVPRNIEKSVGELENIYVYDVDDLTQFSLENERLRKSEIEKAEMIINNHILHLDQLFQNQDLHEIIALMDEKLEQLCLKEFEKLEKKLFLDPKQKKILEKSYKSLKKKWLDLHIQTLKSEEDLSNMAKTLFSHMFRNKKNGN
ncbi:MAG: glutamyl-tRNA reductase, partial [Bdellovibrionales bacterium]|nr:glutamyl-tRNA reductase [Bdellovibrionales bacterium]